ncbi:hypothetical protein GUITHDRAFT_150354 [Guillardia theta CCMP2712]|uniref:Uncharacterized protein n=2 Tax=Guillardia theta TaxID=55529 RepID=L1JY16_GUITC|nr:hypothetical protein GUITHDRAFT_150354 [Guillardia theta CCMP2712]EKX53247.1 hypothetical protein GUITHDRAFT_150354 [Guillardia theta CCMP2712]|eukprot:XP_005840227.1 hypothetical protein GUITHDRAFT_150354 [Guillardia theta CCMP2712]
MLIHVSGQQAKDLNKHLKVINYRRIPGCLMSEEELEDLKWSSANEPPQEEVQTDDVTLDTQQVNLAYPLRTPHKGPASLATTLICHLFDRTRSCIVLELRQGGPWYIRVDLLEIRRRKEYEIAIPRTIASLGQAPDQYEES